MVELKIYRFWELEDDVQKSVIKRYKKTHLTEMMKKYLRTQFTNEIKDIAGDLGIAKGFVMSVNEKGSFSIEIKSGSVKDLKRRLAKTDTTDKEWFLERAEDIIKAGIYRFTILAPVVEIYNETKDTDDDLKLEDVFDKISRYYVKISNDWVERMLDNYSYCRKYLCGEEMTNMMLPSQFGYFTKGGNLAIIDTGDLY